MAAPDLAMLGCDGLPAFDQRDRAGGGGGVDDESAGSHDEAPALRQPARRGKMRVAVTTCPPSPRTWSGVHSAAKGTARGSSSTPAV
ncbi:hypothetical protein WR25_20544 [Diploscapter pachys]|uniref:Uncharacterized protein n=1 Tax=Diploscapter pachys TaxID=2018661 RepID=A0A2A2K7I6_9BILA|nr:hypothetical protein WR25_20544 [Diploscapter pachys]